MFSPKLNWQSIDLTWSPLDEIIPKHARESIFTFSFWFLCGKCNSTTDFVDSVEPFFNIFATDVGLQFTAYSRGRTTIAYALCYCRPYNVVQKLLGPRNISKTLDLPKNNQFVESIQEFLSQNVKNWSEEELRISFSRKRKNSKNWIANTEPRHLLESFT